jgi:hypothetical protein
METIKLDNPITVHGATVSEIKMRMPLVRDMRRAKKGAEDAADQEVRLFADLCELSPEDIDALSVRDYGKLQEAFRGFTG